MAAPLNVGVISKGVSTMDEENVDVVVRGRKYQTKVTIDDKGHTLPVVLLRGIGPSGRWWSFRNELNHTTVALGVPDAGQFPLTAIPRMGEYARVTAAVLEQLGYRRYYLLGLSWGGMLAQELALMHPERVAGLVLVATVHGYTGQPGNVGSLLFLMTPGQLTPERLAKQSGRVFGGAFRENPELAAQFRIGEKVDVIDNMRQAWATVMWSSRHRLPELRDRVPTLALAGSDDPLAPLSGMRTIARLTGAELVVIENGGHLFIWTHQGIAERVERFISSIEQQALPGQSR